VLYAPNRLSAVAKLPTTVPEPQSKEIVAAAIIIIIIIIIIIAPFGHAPN